jgi:hypothetical protein
MCRRPTRRALLGAEFLRDEVANFPEVSEFEVHAPLHAPLHVELCHRPGHVPAGVLHHEIQSRASMSMARTGRHRHGRTSLPAAGTFAGNA